MIAAMIGLATIALALVLAMQGRSAGATGIAGRASTSPTPRAALDSPGNGRASPPAPPAARGVDGSTARGKPFGWGLLIADRGNGRLLIVDGRGRVRWRFPAAHSLPTGQRFSADDAFLSPDGKSIVANDEAHQVIDRIDLATRRVTWQYGHYDRAGSGPGYLHTPDDAYPLQNGDVVVADIRNCRILRISTTHRVVAAWGRAGSCIHHPPRTFNNPNGDTPLPDGGLLVTEIGGSRVVRLSATGNVVFDIHVPVRYPSDAQLDGSGNVLVVDYSNPGAILRLNPRGRLLWRYAPRSGRGRLNHPSLAIPLPDGNIAINDDFRERVLIVSAAGRILWQYGHTDQRGTRDGYLHIPDGIDLVPASTLAAAPGLAQRISLR